MSLLVLPVMCVAVTKVARLILHHPNIGDALFVVGVSGAIWLRRFGPFYARIGTLVSLPFIALLITPAPAIPESGHTQQLWSGVIALVALSWVNAAQWVNRRLRRAPAVPEPLPEQLPQRRPASRRLPASTQMAVALAAAFAVGRALYPQHWSWLVITAYIVGSGNRGRGDVVYKSVLRLTGAAAGAVAATLVAGLFPAGDKTSIVIIFLVLAVAGWLRTLNYAYWAAGMTSILALLNGYFGVSGTALIRERLAGVALGAVIGVLEAWFVLPVKTTDVVRRRIAATLPVLGDYLRAARAPLTSWSTTITGWSTCWVSSSKWRRPSARIAGFRRHYAAPILMSPTPSTACYCCVPRSGRRSKPSSRSQMPRRRWPGSDLFEHGLVGHCSGMKIGYTMMCEQRGPKDLVNDLVLAEQAGFDFSVISDHYSPWLESQGHAPYAWSVLGAAAAKTERIGLMTYVTCPSFRYHPAVVAQKAATMALLSDGRFRLGLGAGENLNEHVVGGGWPPVDVRHERLLEAVEIIRALWAGEFVTYRGKHFDVESAKIYDLPDDPIQLGIAVSGKQSCRLAGAMADICVAIEPNSELVGLFEAAGGSGKPVVGQAGCCYGPNAGEALALVHDQFRWFGGGWKLNAELPGTAGFEAASQFVRKEDLASQIPHGPEVESYVRSAQGFADAGFTEMAFVQVGREQAAFCEWYATTLQPALESAGVTD